MKGLLTLFLFDYNLGSLGISGNLNIFKKAIKRENKKQKMVGTILMAASGQQNPTFSSLIYQVLKTGYFIQIFNAENWAHL